MNLWVSNLDTKKYSSIAESLRYDLWVYTFPGLVIPVVPHFRHQWMNLLPWRGSIIPIWRKILRFLALSIFRRVAVCKAFVRGDFSWEIYTVHSASRNTTGMEDHQTWNQGGRGLIIETLGRCSAYVSSTLSTCQVMSCHGDQACTKGVQRDLRPGTRRSECTVPKNKDRKNSHNGLKMDQMSEWTTSRVSRNWLTPF